MFRGGRRRVRWGRNERNRDGDRDRDKDKDRDRKRKRSWKVKKEEAQKRRGKIEQKGEKENWKDGERKR